MSQMKEKVKIPEKDVNEMKTGNMPDTEFNTLIIKMLNKLRGKIEN